jgi:hypothetical protein
VQNLVQMTLGGRDRLVCFLKHPSAHGTRPSLAASYPEDIERLRMAAGGTA